MRSEIYIERINETAFLDGDKSEAIAEIITAANYDFELTEAEIDSVLEYAESFCEEEGIPCNF